MDRQCIALNPEGSRSYRCQEKRSRTTAMDGYSQCGSACLYQRYLKLYVERPIFSHLIGRVPIQSKRVSPQRRGVAGGRHPDFGSVSDPFGVLSFRPRTSRNSARLCEEEVVTLI